MNDPRPISDVVDTAASSLPDPERLVASADWRRQAGDAFYEPPLHTHRLYRNLSKTEPAELLVFQVNEKGTPSTVKAN